MILTCKVGHCWQEQSGCSFTSRGTYQTSGGQVKGWTEVGRASIVTVNNTLLEEGVNANNTIGLCTNFRSDNRACQCFD